MNLEATPKRFLNDMFTVWIQFIRDPNSIPPEFLGIPEVKEVMDELTKMSADKERRREYEARMREVNRIYAAKRTSFKKGEAKGIKKVEKIGIQKGVTQAKAEIARKLLAMGLPLEQISQALGLSVEELQNLS